MTRDRPHRVVSSTVARKLNFDEADLQWAQVSSPKMCGNPYRLKVVGRRGQGGREPQTPPDVRVRLSPWQVQFSASCTFSCCFGILYMKKMQNFHFWVFFLSLFIFKENLGFFNNPKKKCPGPLRLGGIQPPPLQVGGSDHRGLSLCAMGHNFGFWPSSLFSSVADAAGSMGCERVAQGKPCSRHRPIVPSAAVSLFFFETPERDIVVRILLSNMSSGEERWAVVTRKQANL